MQPLSKIVNEHIGPIGPPVVSPNGPEILIGGYSQEAIRRVGKWGDGYIGRHRARRFRYLGCS